MWWILRAPYAACRRRCIGWRDTAGCLTCPGPGARPKGEGRQAGAVAAVFLAGRAMRGDAARQMRCDKCGATGGALFVPVYRAVAGLGLAVP